MTYLLQGGDIYFSSLNIHGTSWTRVQNRKHPSLQYCRPQPIFVLPTHVGLLSSTEGLRGGLLWVQWAPAPALPSSRLARSLCLVPKHKPKLLRYPTSEPVDVVECQSLRLTPLFYDTGFFSTSSRLTWVDRNRDVSSVQAGRTQLTSSQQAQVSWNHVGKDLKAAFSEIYSKSWEVLKSLY